MSKTYFTSDHEWIRVDGESGTVGITDFAQHALGDVVFVELPEIGLKVARGDDAAVVESVKAASDVYAPLSGEVVAVNGAIVDRPALVNESAEDAGWFLVLRLDDPGELSHLMERAAYDAFVRGLE